MGAKTGAQFGANVGAKTGAKMGAKMGALVGLNNCFLSFLSLYQNIKVVENKCE